MRSISNHRRQGSQAANSRSRRQYNAICIMSKEKCSQKTIKLNKKLYVSIRIHERLKDIIN